MNDRIREIISALKLSDGEFADMVGIKRSTLSHCLSGRNDVSKEIIVKIHNALPNISINWLMFGEGESGLSSTHEETSDINTGLFKTLSNIPAADRQMPEYSKENDFKLPFETIKSADNKPINATTEPVLSAVEPEAEKPAGRKIDKIIIFYTDNTFETFTPD